MSKLAKREPKTFWKYIKKQYKNNSFLSEKPTSNSFHQHFESLYGSNSNTKNDTISNSQNNIHDEQLDRPFTIEELKHNSKSPGVDELTAEIFKDSFDTKKSHVFS